MPFVLRTSYLVLENTRSLLRRDDGRLNMRKGNTRFLAALEIEVEDRNSNCSSLASLPAFVSQRRAGGMTSFLRRSCYKEPSTFPVPEPNDVVIVPAPSYAGSSPQTKSSGQKTTSTRDVSKGGDTFVSPLRGFAGIFVFAGL